MYKKGRVVANPAFFLILCCLYGQQTIRSTAVCVSQLRIDMVCMNLTANRNLKGFLLTVFVKIHKLMKSEKLKCYRK